MSDRPIGLGRMARTEATSPSCFSGHDERREIRDRSEARSVVKPWALASEIAGVDRRWGQR